MKKIPKQIIYSVVAVLLIGIVAVGVALGVRAHRHSALPVEETAAPQSTETQTEVPTESEPETEPEPATEGEIGSVDPDMMDDDFDHFTEKTDLSAEAVAVKEKMRKEAQKIEGSGTAQIRFFSYADYNADGRKEAFAIASKDDFHDPMGSFRLFYADANGCTDLGVLAGFTAEGGRVQIEPKADIYGYSVRIFHNGGSGQTDYMFVVDHDGKPKYTAFTSAQPFMLSDYGWIVAVNSSGDNLQYNWAFNECYARYDAENCLFAECGGIPITTEQFLSMPGTKAIVKQSGVSQSRILSAIYRENGVIHVNYAPQESAEYAEEGHLILYASDEKVGVYDRNDAYGQYIQENLWDGQKVPSDYGVSLDRQTDLETVSFPLQIPYVQGVSAYTVKSFAELYRDRFIGWHVPFFTTDENGKVPNYGFKTQYTDDDRDGEQECRMTIHYPGSDYTTKEILLLDLRNDRIEMHIEKKRYEDILSPFWDE